MKTNSTYSQMTLQRFRPNRRRGWKRKAGCFLWSLVLGALVWALLWVVFSKLPRFTEAQAGKPMLRAAGLGTSDAVVYAIVGLLVIWLVGRLVWRHLAEMGDESRYAREWPCEGATEDDPLAGERIGEMVRVPLLVWEGDTLKREQRAVEAMPEGMTRLDAALICFALASEARLIRELVRGAQCSHSVEDYGDALASAEKRLGDLRTRLWQLKAHFDGGAICESDVGDLPKTYGEAAKTNAGGRP